MAAFKLGLHQPLIRYDGGTRWGVREAKGVIECPSEAEARATYEHLMGRFTETGQDRPELVMAHLHWQVMD